MPVQSQHVCGLVRIVPDPQWGRMQEEIDVARMFELADLGRILALTDATTRHHAVP